MNIFHFSGPTGRGSIAMPTASALLVQAAINAAEAAPYTWGSSALAPSVVPLSAIERAATRWGFASVLEGGAE